MQDRAQELETLALEKIRQNGRGGGLWQDLVQYALKHELASYPTIYVPDIASMIGENALLPVSEWREQGYQYAAFSFAMNKVHQVGVWADLNENSCRVTVYDSDRFPGLETSAKARLAALLNVDESQIQWEKPFYGNQKDNWSCGVHVIANLICQASGKKEANFSVDERLTHYYRAGNDQKQIEAITMENAERAYLVKRTVLEVIEQNAHVQQAQQNTLKPIADYLQQMLWGSTETNRTMLLPQTQEDYGKHQKEDEAGKLILQLASLYAGSPELARVIKKAIDIITNAAKQTQIKIAAIRFNHKSDLQKLEALLASDLLHAINDIKNQDERRQLSQAILEILLSEDSSAESILRRCIVQLGSDYQDSDYTFLTNGENTVLLYMILERLVSNAMTLDESYLNEVKRRELEKEERETYFQKIKEMREAHYQKIAEVKKIFEPYFADIGTLGPLPDQIARNKNALDFVRQNEKNIQVIFNIVIDETDRFKVLSRCAASQVPMTLIKVVNNLHQKYTARCLNQLGLIATFTDLYSVLSGEPEPAVRLACARSHVKKISEVFQLVQALKLLCKLPVNERADFALSCWHEKFRLYGIIRQLAEDMSIAELRAFAQAMKAKIKDEEEMVEVVAWVWEKNPSDLNHFNFVLSLWDEKFQLSIFLKELKAKKKQRELCVSSLYFKNIAWYLQGKIKDADELVDVLNVLGGIAGDSFLARFALGQQDKIKNFKQFSDVFQWVPAAVGPSVMHLMEDQAFSDLESVVKQEILRHDPGLAANTFFDRGFRMLSEINHKLTEIKQNKGTKENTLSAWYNIFNTAEALRHRPVSEAVKKCTNFIMEANQLIKADQQHRLGSP